MKKWINPDITVLEITDTENGKNHNKYEGIDGVDAHGEYNKYINQNGYGTFVPPSDDQDPVHDDVVPEDKMS